MLIYAEFTSPSSRAVVRYTLPLLLALMASPPPPVCFVLGGCGAENRTRVLLPPTATHSSSANQTSALSSHEISSSLTPSIVSFLSTPSPPVPSTSLQVRGTSLETASQHQSNTQLSRSDVQHRGFSERPRSIHIRNRSSPSPLSLYKHRHDRRHHDRSGIDRERINHARPAVPSTSQRSLFVNEPCAAHDRYVRQSHSCHRLRHSPVIPRRNQNPSPHRRT